MLAQALSVAISAVLLSVSIAHAQEPTRARLLTRPSAEQLLDAFPPRALLSAIDGRSVLDCDVGIDGQSECHAIEEQPSAQGFGAAAEHLARDWTFEPATENGQPIASHVRIPIVFNNVIPRPTSIPMLLVPGEPNNSTEEYPHRPSYYPESARAAGVSGYALLACATRSNNNLDCEVEGEFPNGYGFAERALALLRENPSERERFIQTFRLTVVFYLEDTPPIYERRPTGSQFGRYYPTLALQRGIEGRAYPVCEIQTDRTVECVEGPSSGHGFGEAAVHLANEFVISESMFGMPGFTAGERLEIPITFRISR